MIVIRHKNVSQVARIRGKDLPASEELSWKPKNKPEGRVFQSAHRSRHQAFHCEARQKASTIDALH